jgi:triphosphoribosyl-dephospho-CoA synthetase
MEPSYLGHSGETKTVEHDVENLAQIEAEMQCVAAGNIAERILFSFPEELTDDKLIKCFRRYTRRVDEDPDQDSNFPPSDGLRFARLGRARDAEILKATSNAVTGPATWLPVFRQTERLIEGELRQAVKAVAYELARNPDDLHNEDVATLAGVALGRTES